MKEVDAFQMLSDAKDMAKNFLNGNESAEAKDYVMQRMIQIADCQLRGRGAKVDLPSGDRVPFSKIKQFVNRCADKADRGFDGPLDYMDRDVGAFVAKITNHPADRKFIEYLCYDLNTID